MQPGDDYRHGSSSFVIPGVCYACRSGGVTDRQQGTTTWPISTHLHCPFHSSWRRGGCRSRRRRAPGRWAARRRQGGCPSHRPLVPAAPLPAAEAMAPLALASGAPLGPATRCRRCCPRRARRSPSELAAAAAATPIPARRCGGRPPRKTSGGDGSFLLRPQAGPPAPQNRRGAPAAARRPSPRSGRGPQRGSRTARCRAGPPTPLTGPPLGRSRRAPRRRAPPAAALRRRGRPPGGARWPRCPG